MRALRTLAERLPDADWERIPTQTRVLAPSEDTLGLVHPVYTANTRIVYFSPRLKSLPQSTVDRVVAHEFAYAILGHEDGESFPSDAAPKDET
jgi:hypothetical protein